MTATPSAEVIKACCADAYSSDVIELLMGASYHPGGLGLTRTLLSCTHTRPGMKLLDVASGRGTSALLAAAEFGAHVTGVDLSAANIEAAAAHAATLAMSTPIDFHVGDAESLPFASSAFDVVICECALCTFPDKAAAAAHFARVLRPGGRVGITDITADPERLPDELRGFAARIACIADARPAEEYAQILTDSGLRIQTIEPHDQALARMIDQIEARLTAVKLVAADRAAELGIDFTRAPAVLQAARAAVADNTLGYALIVAAKPH